ncbi:uncharacterized protein B0H18DRAFT_1216616 [Fomitopsis serialis]|uniref:uncharacterized protein n=1 Tax=Fomitopsis serialis TaxID=139415 RepID=UPI0020077997|nr:uncharacterized protein B0H18DRAFT_1216616 [Neoantrodia serialis]KAH9913177.1 hypothetical protein B0H18DRAFT_1216616 [Neoantrodia serialis]
MPLYINDFLPQYTNDVQALPSSSSTSMSEPLKDIWSTGREPSLAYDASIDEIMEAHPYVDFLADRPCATADRLARAESPAPPLEWEFRPDLPVLPSMPIPQADTYAQPAPAPPSSNTLGTDSTPAAESSAGDEPARDDEGRRPTKRAKYEGPARHKCIWRFKDGSRCTWEGTAQAGWDHVRSTHNLAHLTRPEPPQAPVQCGWGGCPFRGLPEATYQHWRAAHQPTMAKTKTAGEGGAKPKTQCGVCSLVVRRANLLKHLKHTHWGFEKWCDGCGQKFRPDVFDKRARDHRGDCLGDLMRYSPHFRR